MDEQWDSVSSICKEQDGMPDDVEKNGICRIKDASESVQYRNTSVSVQKELGRV